MLCQQCSSPHLRKRKSTEMTVSQYVCNSTRSPGWRYKTLTSPRQQFALCALEMHRVLRHQDSKPGINQETMERRRQMRQLQQTTNKCLPVGFDLPMFFLSTQVNKAQNDVCRYLQFKCVCQKDACILLIHIDV